jgi:light-harvesting complex 1 beta chain
MQHTKPLDDNHPFADESTAFWTIFLLAYSLLFAVALLARVAGIHWREYLPGAESANSMSEGVKAAIYTFMSHII